MSLNNITFSVIVCMHNEEKWIRESIQSLLNQDYDKSKYEIIVIDDESNDKCTDYVQDIITNNKGKSPQLKLIRIEHGGLSIARNTGVSNAKGKYLLFIDGDAIANPDWIRNYESTFENSNCDYSSGTIDLLNTENSFARLLHNTRFKQSFKGSKHNYLHGVNMGFKKEVFEEYGGFYENFDRRGDDTSFSIVIKKTKKWNPSKDSIVLHERPESFSEWFRVYKRELIDTIRIYKVLTLHDSSSALSYLIPSFKSSIIILFICLSIFNVYFVIPLLLLILLFKRSYFGKKHNSSKEYLFSGFIQILDLLLRFPFAVASSFKHYNIKLSKPHSSVKKVLIYEETIASN